MDSEAETEKKQALLTETARTLRVELKMHENLQSHLEGIFSRGDRRVADVLERAFRLGCRFDGWDDVLRLDLWDQAFEEAKTTAGLEVARYLGTIPVTARLPWDHIDIGLEPDFLLKEYRKALKDRLSPPCGKPYKKLLHPATVEEAEAGRKDKLICYDCGVACDLGAMKEERLYYLRRMNAWTKAEVGATAAPVANALPPAASPAVAMPSGRPRPPTRIVQPASHRYRLRYTKLGRTIFLGHLDLIRHLPRVFRRAGWELAYSAGFHPKPELTFGPALGLGVPSVAELMDVKVVDDVSPEELVARLEAKTLPGISWLGAVRLGESDRALGRVLTNAQYLLRLPAGVAVEEGLSLYAEGAPLVVRRHAGSKGDGDDASTDELVRDTVRNVGPRIIRGATLGRTIDVRRSLGAVQLVGDRAETFTSQGSRLSEVLRRLGWDEDDSAERPLVLIATRVSQELAARPREIAQALWGAAVAGDTDVARLGLAGGSLRAPIDVLETALLRATVDQATAATGPDLLSSFAPSSPSPSP
jgi:radical SAM-linked protein